MVFSNSHHQRKKQEIHAEGGVNMCPILHASYLFFVDKQLERRRKHLTWNRMEPDFMIQTKSLLLYLFFMYFSDSKVFAFSLDVSTGVGPSELHCDRRSGNDYLQHV